MKEWENGEEGHEILTVLHSRHGCHTLELITAVATCTRPSQDKANNEFSHKVGRAPEAHV